MNDQVTEGSAVAAGAPTPREAVTGVDRRTLDSVFRHPLAHNLSWREVVSLIDAIGTAEEKHNGEFVLHVGEERLPLKRPHGKDLTSTDVMDIRHLLTRAGWSARSGGPASAPEPAASAPDAARLIVVIDHAGARVYRLDPADDAAAPATATESRHMLHHIEHKRRDEDRDEVYPDDERFFESVAAAVATGGEIVVIGHGKGQSNEADHLSAYLQSHHKAVHARIVREIVADLPRLTTPELLDLGRHAFG